MGHLYTVLYFSWRTGGVVMVIACMLCVRGFVAFLFLGLLSLQKIFNAMINIIK